MNDWGLGQSASVLGTVGSSCTPPAPVGTYLIIGGGALAAALLPGWIKLLGLAVAGYGVWGLGCIVPGHGIVVNSTPPCCQSYTQPQCIVSM